MPGTVKTRLARDIGAAEALAVHETLLRGAVERLSAHPRFELELWVAGDPEHAFVARLATAFGLPVRRQAGAELGARESESS